MHLCCESTRFEHRVIVDRGAKETCPSSPGLRSARGSEEREQHDARHLVRERRRMRDALRRLFLEISGLSC